MGEIGLCALASFTLACSSGAEVREPPLGEAGSNGVEPPSDSESPAPPPAVSAPPFADWPGFSVAELPESGARTTPDVIALVLESNADRIHVQAAITDATGRWFTPCSEHEVYRIGPAAEPWEVGDARVFTLAYGATMSDGYYALSVRVSVNERQGSTTYLYFAVSDGSFRRVSEEEFSEAFYPVMVDSLGRTYINALPPIDDSDPAFRDPCSEPPPYTDGVAEGGWTQVAVDDWVGGTIQPLRWRPAQILDSGTRIEPELAYHLRDEAGATLELRVAATSNEPAPISSPLNASALTLEKPGASGEAPTTWYAIGGRVEVTPISDGELQVELFDVLLDKSRMYTEPPVRRTLPRASIIGRWLSETR